MMLSQVKHVLRESGLCLDSVRLLDWIKSSPRAKILFFRFLRLRFSPGVLEDALNQAVGSAEKSRLFSLGMSFLNVGNTYKTTGENRTGLADNEIAKLAGGYDTPRLLEVGVSDGISSCNNLRNKSFVEVVLTDRFNCFYEKRMFWGRKYYDSSRRLLGIKFLVFYINLCLERQSDISGTRKIETANPILAEEFGITSIRPFDLFQDRLDEPVNIIKCANILNESYFSGEEIRRAVDNLGLSLSEDGCIVISHNNEKYEDGEALAVLRKKAGGFHLEKELNGHELVQLFRGDSYQPVTPLMKILFLIPSLEVGGAENQLVSMANGLAAAGHIVAVALHYSGGELEQRLKNVKVIQLNKAGRWDFAGFSMRLIRAVRAFRPEVVCSFLGTPNILTAALKPFFRPAKVFWSVRSSDMDLSQYDWATSLGSWLEVRLSSLADGIMINSCAGRDHALSKGMSPDSMKLVFNGFDVDRFSPAHEMGGALRKQWGVPDDALLVGLVARLDPMKDHGTFFKAAKIIAQQDDSIRFICIGDGPLGKDFENQGRDLGLGDRLIWAGPQSDMPAVYNALDICCLSSISEGFPNVLGEAMACGVPCVTTNVGDAAMLVGDTGLVVERRDPEALARAILEMADRIRSGEVSDTRTRIVENFSMASMVGRVEFLMAGEK